MAWAYRIKDSRSTSYDIYINTNMVPPTKCLHDGGFPNIVRVLLSFLTIYVNPRSLVFGPHSPQVPELGPTLLRPPAPDLLLSGVLPPTLRLFLLLSGVSCLLALEEASSVVPAIPILLLLLDVESFSFILCEHHAGL